MDAMKGAKGMILNVERCGCKEMADCGMDAGECLVGHKSYSAEDLENWVENPEDLEHDKQCHAKMVMLGLAEDRPYGWRWREICQDMTT